MLKAVLACDNLVQDGKLPTKLVREKFNLEKDERERKTEDWVGRKLARLGSRTVFSYLALFLANHSLLLSLASCLRNLNISGEK